MTHLAPALEAHAPHDPHHAASITCVSLELNEPVHLPQLRAWLSALMERKHDDVYRLKGVLCIAGHDARFVLHGVHAEVHGHFERPWAPSEARKSSLVVIGHGLDHDELARGFEGTAGEGEAIECDAPAPAPPPARRPKKE